MALPTACSDHRTHSTKSTGGALSHVCRTKGPEDVPFRCSSRTSKSKHPSNKWAGLGCALTQIFSPLPIEALFKPLFKPLLQ